MATILVCDKCKKQLPATSYRRMIVENAAGSKLRDIDLCRECYELIEDIITNPYKYNVIDKSVGDPLKEFDAHCTNSYREL